MKRVLMLLCALLLCAAALSGCAKDAAPKDGKAANGEVILSDKTLRTGFEAQDDCRVFYEIFVGSFSDSDGNGVGDLRGIINRFDYLNDGDPDSGLSLGVEGIWLTPIFQSPSYHKYDVTDYYTIDPTFGTQEDLEDLIALCHERNVRLILDLPINHTGAKNEWFSRFRSAHIKKDVSDPYYDFYSFHARGESGSGSYAQLPGTQDYYECNFSGDMPELNFDSAEARAAVVDVAKHYLDLGVDGFRFDAAKYIYLGETEKSVDFWEWYMDELRKIDPNVYAIAEVWDADSITNAYYPALDCFNFTTAGAEGLIDSTAKAGYVEQYTFYIADYLKTIQAKRPDAMLHEFISNHDTDRASGYLTLISGQMQLAASLYLLTPGSPFIYYGEEIGLKGSRGGANTDANRRLAMRWGDGDTVKDPAGSTYEEKNQVNGTVADQVGKAGSLFEHYQKILALRKANPAIAEGKYTALDLKEIKAGGFIAEKDDNIVCVIHNTSKGTERIPLTSLSSVYTFSEVNGVLGQGEAYIEDGKLVINGLTSVVLRPGQ
jgi:glycosidase